jgi:uncharacterized Zn-finger protein
MNSVSISKNPKDFEEFTFKKRLFWEGMVYDTCSRKFHYARELQNHKKIHMGQKSCICPVCKCGFTRPYTLKIHSFTHTGEKPFKCDKCELSFTKNWRLNLHRDDAHDHIVGEEKSNIPIPVRKEKEM